VEAVLSAGERGLVQAGLEGFEADAVLEALQE